MPAKYTTRMAVSVETGRSGEVIFEIMGVKKDRARSDPKPLPE